MLTLVTDPLMVFVQFPTFVLISADEVGLKQETAYLIRSVVLKTEFVATASINAEEICHVVKYSRAYSTPIRTDYHFGAEESMFELKQYPDADIHIERRMEFQERLKAFKDEFEAGDGQVGAKLIEFLFPWWSNHILEFDKKYVQYLKG